MTIHPRLPVRSSPAPDAPRRGRASALGMALCAGLILSACAEKQTYLPGLREDIRSVLKNPGIAEVPAPRDMVNASLPIALGGQTNNANWAQSAGTAQFRVSNAALRAEPQPAWSADIGAGDSRKLRITADPVVADGRVFTLDAGAGVAATSTSGAPLWRRDLTPATDRAGQGTGGGLAVDGDTLYVSIGFGILAALDTATGAVRWTQELEATGSGTPTVWGDMVYLTAGDDTGWAVEKSNGRIAWQTSATTSVNNVLGAPAPALSDQLAIFGFGSGEVQAVFRQGGVPRWNVTVVGKRPGRALAHVADLTSAPVVAGDRVFVGNQSGRLSALSLGSGERLWTAREGAVGKVWPAGDSVFVVTDLNELVRLDAATGERIWGVPLPKFVKEKPKKQSQIFAQYGPIMAGGRLIVASDDGLLRSFDPTDGHLTGTLEIPGGATTAPVVAGGTLYVVSSKGQLHAFR